jgi:predicted ATP-grasp superfamily ATP-dependent carboligase
VWGIDHEAEHEGFRSVYGRSLRCPNPDTEASEWIHFMHSLSQTIGSKAALIPAADVFVAAIGRHADELQEAFLFSRSAAEIQAKLATKEQQYALAGDRGFPMPLTRYVRSSTDIVAFAGQARFPVILKPRHQREWESLPARHPLMGRKGTVVEAAAELLKQYRLVEPHRPEGVVQEVVLGPDNAKYCYLSVYGADGSRLGYCVVREHRCYPAFFGSASVVSPVEDAEIEGLCDSFLRGVGYVGVCEIEVKRDERDGAVKLIEINPRVSGTGDCAKYAGVDIGWLHYLDLIGSHPEAAEPTRFNVRHITVRRDLPAIAEQLTRGLGSLKEILRSYRPPIAFYDVDFRDLRVTVDTAVTAARRAGGITLRHLGLRRRTSSEAA